VLGAVRASAPAAANSSAAEMRNRAIVTSLADDGVMVGWFSDPISAPGVWGSSGGSDYHTYGVFFVVVFVWIGVSQPRGTSLLAAAAAAVAYVLPLFVLPGGLASGLGSAALTIAVCMVVGQSVAWGVRRIRDEEEELRREREAADRLRALDEVKDALMSMISHELRVPITICRGHLDILDPGLDPAETRDVLVLVGDELRRMQRLVNDISTFLSTRNTIELHEEEVALEALVSGLAAKAQPLVGGKLRVHPDRPDVTVTADPQRLAQTMLNLLQNAATHASSSNAVDLWVREEAQAWRFEVTEDGAGLPAGLAFERHS
jgi:signal transduction histidine kinase